LNLIIDFITLLAKCKANIKTITCNLQGKNEKENEKTFGLSDKSRFGYFWRQMDTTYYQRFDV